MIVPRAAHVGLPKFLVGLTHKKVRNSINKYNLITKDMTKTFLTIWRLEFFKTFPLRANHDGTLCRARGPSQIFCEMPLQKS